MTPVTRRVAICGYGTVGRSVLKIHDTASAGFDLKKILLRNQSDSKGLASDYDGKYASLIEDDPERVWTSDDIDIVVELIGGADGVAWDIVSNSLKNNKKVVTANKSLMAKHWNEIAEVNMNANLIFFDAAVGGGVPMIPTILDSFCEDPIQSISGILNGTTNVILDMMTEGNSYEEALKQCQIKGYAEADPTYDVDGFDSRDKLMILIKTIWKNDVYDGFDGSTRNPADVVVTGIRGVTPLDIKEATANAKMMKLWCHAEKNDAKVVGYVRPMAVDSQQFKIPMGEDNILIIKSCNRGTTVITGQGCGGACTAASVIADIGRAARSIKNVHLDC